MKKLIASLILAASIALSGCGDSDDDFVFVQQQGAGVVQGFFVNAATGNDATGNFATGSPFATVQAALAAAGVNGTVRVFPGNYTGAVTLLNGQRLLGSGSVLAQGVARPVLAGPINMADGNTIDFIAVNGTAGNAIDAQDRNGGTVTNCVITNLTALGVGVNVNSGTGSWKLSNNTVTNAAGSGVVFSSGTGDVATVRVNGNTVTMGGTGAIGFTAAGNAQVNAQVSGNTMTGSLVAGDTFQALVGGTSTLCLDVVSNTNDDAYRLANGATSTLNIEQFATLLTINSGGAVISTATNVTPVANGSCGF